MNDKTLSTNELIDALENAGRTPDLDLIRTCVARVEELEPALLDLLRIDPEERYDDMEDELDDPRIYSDVHAGYLLIAARSLAALPIFGEILRDEERQDLFEWFAPELHHYGSAALPVFTELLLDEAAYLYGRSWAAAILRKIAQLEPENQTAVIATLHQLLPPVPPGKVEARDEMWTWAVLELGKLGDKTHLEQIEALFAAGAIDTWIIGEYEDYLELLEEDPGDMSASYDIIEIYAELHDEAAHHAEVTAEWARQNEAKSAFQARQNKIEAELKDMLDRQAERAAARAAARGERPSSTHEQAMPGEPTIRKEPKVGRNDPCPCGSGQKYKKCHGRPGAK